MLMHIPDDVYRYMDTRGEKPVIIAKAPESVKKQAREIDKIVLEKTGTTFFKEIK
nr:MAG TPA: hypothetical protein [Caudoviricetes sp.]